MALTATATESVRKVIKCSLTQQLGHNCINWSLLSGWNLQDVLGALRIPNAVILKRSFDRLNLNYEVIGKTKLTRSSWVISWKSASWTNLASCTVSRRMNVRTPPSFWGRNTRSNARITMLAWQLVREPVSKKNGTVGRLRSSVLP